jgi:hypothetical protein
MGSLATLICTGLALGALTTRGYGQTVSLWNYDGSVMALHTEGASAIIRYESPHHDLQWEALQSGAVLFSGIKDGNAVFGTAYTFARRCGAQPYLVSGNVSADGGEIIMYGATPLGFDGGCRPIVFQDARLVFTHVRPVPSPIVTGSITQDPPQPQAAAVRAQLDEIKHGVRDEAAAAIRAPSVVIAWSKFSAVISGFGAHWLTVTLVVSVGLLGLVLVPAGLRRSARALNHDGQVFPTMPVEGPSTDAITTQRSSAGRASDGISRKEADYTAKVRAAALQLVTDRCILDKDVDRVVETAIARYRAALSR